MGLPGVALGLLAHLVGWGTPSALLAAGIGGIGGYLVSTRAAPGAALPSPALPAHVPSFKDVCLADLDAETRGPVEKAIHENDGVALAAYVKQASDHGWECAAKEIAAKLKVVEDAAATAAATAVTAEKDRRAKLDVTAVVVDATEPLVTQVATALLMFTVTTVSGEADYGSAIFPLKPTDLTVTMLDDTAVALGAAGYTKAQSQIVAASGAAKTARDAP